MQMKKISEEDFQRWKLTATPKKIEKKSSIIKKVEARVHLTEENKSRENDSRLTVTVTDQAKRRNIQLEQTNIKNAKDQADINYEENIKDTTIARFKLGLDLNDLNIRTSSPLPSATGSGGIHHINNTQDESEAKIVMVEEKHNTRMAKIRYCC